MAEMWKSQDIEVYRNWVKAILDEASDELNDWESNFVQNMENLVEAGKQLSENQAKKLETIYSEKTK